MDLTEDGRESLNSGDSGSELIDVCDSQELQNESVNCPTPKSRTSLRVSVQREDIAAAQMHEGDEELQQLGVDVYDQQTYERSVFNQVDKAITDVGPTTTSQQSNGNQEASNINDLMRIIQDDKGDNHEQQSAEKDEQILLLARQERLNRIRIKQERVKNVHDDALHDPLLKVTRIPRFSNSNSAIEVTPQPSTSRASIKQEQANPDSEPIEEIFVSDSESSSSEYQPPENQNIDTDEDDVDYATDEGPDDHTQESDSSSCKSSRIDKKHKIRDDGDFKTYSKRIKAYTKARAKKRLENILEDGTESIKLDEMIVIDGNLKILKNIWDNLFEHQKTGVRWLWELHQLGTGGILGDEMGLGKTIQMIAFLAALRSSNITSLHKRYENLGPVVLVCPATVMHQWLVELRKWSPQFRVAILHNTGSFSGDKSRLVEVIHKSRGILICSYSGAVIYQDHLHALDWHYAILDEGHKIRNPDAQVTLACKRFRTPHRIILSGSPVQNNLRELWSIFDFIYPGKLGTLPVFMGHFGIPITQGGYANATDIQVQIAYKCACVLRDTIKPFLLRRTKQEVNSKLKLPDKSEQVLFCKLTARQRELYEYYLKSPMVKDITQGMCQVFVGLIQLRKICNHPDLFDATQCTRQVKEHQKGNDKQIKFSEYFATDETYGHHEKSGKMMVVEALLKLWKKQNHKVLLFTQSRQMLRIFMKYLDMKNFKYLWMDGSTSIGSRHSLIDNFNNDDEIFIFLLTTRVGGVGVNLIGANRIIIYDPDWNPSTDIQARERAWRIGQKRHVIIYRLLTAGTIEEKIYHRQVFKLYLTNRILKDAKQKRFFKTNDLHELFTLGHDDKNIETKALFDEDMQINEKCLKKRKRKKKLNKNEKKLKATSNENSSEPSSVPVLSEEKLREMRDRAKRISQMISQQYGDKSRESHTTIPIKVEKVYKNSVIFNNADMTAETGKTVSDKGLLNDNSNLFDPIEPVPYCPAWSIPSNDDSNLQGISSSVASSSKKQHVDYLVRQDIYKPVNKSKDSRYKSDDYILGRLFKHSNISGALKHDEIESNSTADYKIVESEAEKVARDAIRVLRESRRMCLGSTSGIPNWTGRNGHVASQPRLIPKNKARAQQIIGHRASASSSNDSLISSMRKRNQVNPISLASRSDDLFDTNDEERNRDFQGRAADSGADITAQKIRDFVLYQAAINGEAQTDELLDFFKKNFKANQTAVFKAILYKVCELQRRGDKGFWKLKSEFRDL